MDQTLPASTYSAPSRPARRTPLNTIIEESQRGSDNSDTDEGTIIGRPAEFDERLFVAVPRVKRSDLHQVESTADRRSDEWQGRPPDFDDMYDVSDVETEFSDSCPSLRDSLSSRPTSFGTDSTRYSMASNRSSRTRYPSLLIPSTASLPSLSSPLKSSSLPPSPPPKIPVSPAVLELLPSLVPALYATPSLDGSSCTSEQVSNISAPVTPDMQNLGSSGDQWGRAAVRVQRNSENVEEAIAEPDTQSEVSIVIDHIHDWQSVLDSFPMITQEMQQHRGQKPISDQIRQENNSSPSDIGVELPEDALETLRHISQGIASSYRSDSPTTVGSAHEMREVSNPPSRPRSTDGVTPASEYSSYSFTELSVPSPGGFFSSLNAGDRNPWTEQPEEPEVPTSAVAERFYNLPWDQPKDRIMEQIVEVDEALTDGPPTARQFEFPAHLHDGDNLSVNEAIQEIPKEEYDESYETELLRTANANLDRTSVWLAAQTSYLSILKQEPESEKTDRVSEKQNESVPAHNRDTSLESGSRKTVRFDENPVSNVEFALEATKRESLFHQGFQSVVEQAAKTDTFVHRAARYDAIEASRLATVDLHIKTLQGKYEVVEPTRPKYSGPFSQNPRATGMFETPAQIAFMTVERERNVLEQLQPASWVVDAIKYMNGGRLLTNPAMKRLAKAPLPLTDPMCRGQHRLRVLDLGGQASCDWAWHCANTYPNVKVYTVATKQQTVNSGLNGPSNHRVVTVPRLWQLPFKNGYFDVISARSLHALLRSELNINGTNCEFDMCLKECFRVLKPGGYLEYAVMDSSFARAGPRASALSVEFGFNLRLRGYDPEPTKTFASRLRKAHFTNNRSAWIFLPMGAEHPDKKELRETPFPQCPSVSDLANYEAVQGPVGSTAEIASVAGLLGGWMWEQWKIKLESEVGKEEHRWLDGVSDAIREGRDCHAGYRMLTGWTQKPRRRVQHHI